MKRRPTRFLAVIVAALFIFGACSAPESSDSTAGSRPDLPPIDGAGIRALIAASDRPLVINVWASWCVPCRSEAPLLRRANDLFGDEVTFIGIDTQDRLADGQSFIVEFGLDGFDHYFDQAGAVRAELGGIGVPITYFVDQSGDVTIHQGIIDERTLVLGIDEIR